MNEFEANLLSTMQSFKEIYNQLIDLQENDTAISFYDYMTSFLSIYFDISFEIKFKLKNLRKHFESSVLSASNLPTQLVKRFESTRTIKRLKQNLCFNTFFLLGNFNRE